MTLRNSMRLLGRLLVSALVGLFWLVALSAYVEFALPLATLYALSVVSAFAAAHVWWAWPHWSAKRLQWPAPEMWSALPVGLAAAVLLTSGQAAWLLVANDLPPPEPTPTTEWYLLPVLAVLAYPVIEEIVFRGWMQKPLEDQVHPALAIIIPAAVFAALHSDTFFSMHLLMGCFYGAAAWVSRSVWIAAALHAMANAVVAPLDLLSELPAVDQWLRATAGAGPLWLDVAAVGLLAAGSIGGAGWIYGLWRNQRGSPP